MSGIFVPGSLTAAQIALLNNLSGGPVALASALATAQTSITACQQKSLSGYLQGESSFTAGNNVYSAYTNISGAGANTINGVGISGWVVAGGTARTVYIKLARGTPGNEVDFHEFSLMASTLLTVDNFNYWVPITLPLNSPISAAAKDKNGAGTQITLTCSSIIQ